jgi:hypothetical protein
LTACQAAANRETVVAQLPSRIQIAQRIRQDLISEIDHEILVERLLDDARYARDVLLVCEALTGGDLPALATMFREATAALPGRDPPAQAAPQRPGRAQQPNDWSHDTSGFGVTHPPTLTPETGPDQADRRRPWLERWRRN